MVRKILVRSWITSAVIMALLLSFSMVAVAAGGPPGGAGGHFIVALNKGERTRSPQPGTCPGHIAWGLGLCLIPS